MLSVNRVLGFLFISLFNVSIYAVDVSTLDISGIRLGMSKIEVLRKMPCNNPREEVHKLENKKIRGGWLICGDYESEWTSVTFDHNEHAIRVTKHIKFSVEPNFEKIKNKLINKYGRGNTTAYSYRPKEGSLEYSSERFCWGNECEEYFHDEDDRGGSNIDYSEYAQQLIAGYIFRINDGHRFELRLSDPVREGVRDIWVNNEKEKIKRQQREKESNFNF